MKLKYELIDNYCTFIYLFTYHTGRPPSTIEGAEILNGTVDLVTNRILLDITWESPDPFGELKHYEIVLLSAEFDNPNATVNRTFASRSLSVSIFTVFKIFHNQ